MEVGDVAFRILVVDDQPDHRDLIGDALTRRFPDVEITEASTAAAVLELLEKTCFDGIILDYILPDSTALDMLPRVFERCEQAPVIITTARGNETVAVEALKAGASDYIVKSAHLADHLPLALQNAIETARLRREKEADNRRIAHLNAVLRAIRNVNQLIMREPDPERLLQGACDSLVETHGYGSAWVVVLDEQGEITGGHQAGLDPEMFSTFISRLQGGERPACFRSALESPQMTISVNETSAHADCLLASLHHDLGVLVKVIRCREKVFGVMAASVPQGLVRDSEEQELFSELVDDVGIALHTLFEEAQHLQSEQALRQSEQSFRTFVESAPVGIAIRRGLDLIYANPALLRMVGYDSADEVPEGSVLSLYPPEDREALRARMLARDHGERPISSYDVTIMTRDGHRVPHRIDVAELTLPDGPAAIGFHTDLSERVSIEQELRREISVRQKAEQDLLEHQAQLRRLAVELSLAEEQERRRVGTQLHDVVVQFLAYAKLKLGLLRKTNMDAMTLAAVEEAETLLQQAIDRSRRVMYELSAFSLYDLGFEPALQALCDHFRKQHHLHVTFNHDTAPKPLPPDLQVMLFQVTRELLLNVVEHARATQATVSLSRADQQIQIVIEDNGTAVGALTIDQMMSPQHFGLFSISERLGYLGGSVDVENLPERGTRVTIRLPLQESPVTGQS